MNEYLCRLIITYQSGVLALARTQLSGCAQMCRPRQQPITSGRP